MNEIKDRSTFEDGKQLVKTLRPERDSRERSEYRDVARDLSAQSARIYLFRRAEV